MERTSSSAKFVRRLRTAAAALAALVLFSAGTCQVSYCSDGHDDCDPCVAACRCDKVCVFAVSSDPRELFGLRSYELVTTADEGGAWSRSYRKILGPSVARAFGERELSRDVLELFARNVVRTNASLFGPLDAWSIESVDPSDAGILIRLSRAGDVEGSLLFWLDARGRLLEVEHRGAL